MNYKSPLSLLMKPVRYREREMGGRERERGYIDHKDDSKGFYFEELLRNIGFYFSLNKTTKDYFIGNHCKSLTNQ